VGIEGEGLAVLPPWQKLYNFSIRAEKADIENAEGSTSDTQPVKVSMTVRYSIATDKVAEVFEKYSHDGDLSSYVQQAQDRRSRAEAEGRGRRSGGQGDHRDRAGHRAEPAHPE
jgi:regulator of protease activity HflC (stomatin/prohibitin superfamily)